MPRLDFSDDDDDDDSWYDDDDDDEEALDQEELFSCEQIWEEGGKNLRQRKFKQALHCYQALLLRTRDPGGRWTPEELSEGHPELCAPRAALCHLRCKRPDKAIDIIKRVIRQNAAAAAADANGTGDGPAGPPDPELLLLLSIALFQERDYKQCALAASHALANHPEYVEEAFRECIYQSDKLDPTATDAVAGMMDGRDEARSLFELCELLFPEDREKAREEEREMQKQQQNNIPELREGGHHTNVVDVFDRSFLLCSIFPTFMI